MNFIFFLNSSMAGHVKKSIVALFIVMPGICFAQTTDTLQHINAERRNSAEMQSKPYVILISADGFRYDYAKKYKRLVEMQQLSMLELMIVSEDFKGAIQYAGVLEKELKQIQHVTLLRYLKASAEIGNNLFDTKSKAELLNHLKTNKKSISGWSYELFFDWLCITRMPKEKEQLIRSIAESLI